MDYPSSRKPKTSYSTSRSHSSRASSTFSRPDDTALTNPYSQLTGNDKKYVSPYGDPHSSATSRNASRHPATPSLRLSDPSSPSSTSSQDSELSIMSASKAAKKMSMSDKDQMLRSLKTHRVNTLADLRRIEKLFDGDASKEVVEALTTGWAHYVNSNNLLSELRGMTKNYPFASECLDEAKWQVIGDPSSTKSWNYCWLILSKIKSESLIKKHARQLAAKPAMWGGKSPTPGGIEKLATACVAEWTRAIESMLRQWSTPPKTK